MNDLSDATYVRQDLAEMVRRQEQTPQGIEEVEEEVLRQFKDALEAHHQVVVVGRAGRGKTSLLYWAVQRQLDVLTDDPTALVPLYIPFAELPVGGRRNLEDYCRGAIAGGDPRIGQWLWNHVNKGNVLLLIDALDEVPGRERLARLNDSSLFAEIVRELLAPDARIVLTCRDSAYPELRDRLLELRRPGTREGFVKMELKPFTMEQIADYARKFFGDGTEAEEFLKAIQDPRV
ncbi:MAG: NACHT domain-containing protein, partial [Armatimonadetes bacterium]|nr:NACHT domain-containing protein [Armatimonadota bacterium]